MLLAKGSDFLALKIREIGAKHNILLLESPYQPIAAFGHNSGHRGRSR